MPQIPRTDAAQTPAQFPAGPRSAFQPTAPRRLQRAIAEEARQLQLFALTGSEQVRHGEALLELARRQQAIKDQTRAADIIARTTLDIRSRVGALPQSGLATEQLVPTGAQIVDDTISEALAGASDLSPEALAGIQQRLAGVRTDTLSRLGATSNALQLEQRVAELGRMEQFVQSEFAAADPERQQQLMADMAGLYDTAERFRLMDPERLRRRRDGFTKSLVTNSLLSLAEEHGAEPALEALGKSSVFTPDERRGVENKIFDVLATQNRLEAAQLAEIERGVNLSRDTIVNQLMGRLMDPKAGPAVANEVFEAARAMGQTRAADGKNLLPARQAIPIMRAARALHDSFVGGEPKTDLNVFKHMATRIRNGEPIHPAAPFARVGIDLSKGDAALLSNMALGAPQNQAFMNAPRHRIGMDRLDTLKETAVANYEALISGGGDDSPINQIIERQKNEVERLLLEQTGPEQFYRVDPQIHQQILDDAWTAVQEVVRASAKDAVPIIPLSNVQSVDDIKQAWRSGNMTSGAAQAEMIRAMITEMGLSAEEGWLMPLSELQQRYLEHRRQNAGSPEQPAPAGAGQ